MSFTGSFFISLILAGGAYPFGDLALFFFFLFEVFVVAVALLADVEGNVAVLDHVADLTLHGDRKEDAKVDQEDGPEDWDVKHSEQGAEERNHYRACCRVPNISRIKIKELTLATGRQVGPRLFFGPSCPCSSVSLLRCSPKPFPPFVSMTTPPHCENCENVPLFQVTPYSQCMLIKVDYRRFPCQMAVVPPCRKLARE